MFEKPLTVTEMEQNKVRAGESLNDEWQKKLFQPLIDKVKELLKAKS